LCSGGNYAVSHRRGQEKSVKPLRAARTYQAASKMLSEKEK
jgi:hypothetical protein